MLTPAPVVVSTYRADCVIWASTPAASPTVLYISSTDLYNAHISKLNKDIIYKYLNPIIGS
jgi:hypothetical protein